MTSRQVGGAMKGMVTNGNSNSYDNDNSNDSNDDENKHNDWYTKIISDITA